VRVIDVFVDELKLRLLGLDGAQPRADRRRADARSAQRRVTQSGGCRESGARRRAMGCWPARSALAFD
jgi:hypothetical protein